MATTDSPAIALFPSNLQLTPCSEQWTSAAPSRVRRQYRQHGDAAGWSAWMAHLARRKRPRPVAEVLPQGIRSLECSLANDAADGAAAEVVRCLGSLRFTARPRSGIDDELALWLTEADTAQASEAAAVQSLAWCYALPVLSAHVPEDLWWRAVNQLLALLDDAAAGAGSSPAVWQLTAGELPLALSYVLPEIEPCRRVRVLARDALARGLCELLNAEGFPDGHGLNSFRSLVMCWSRCCLLGERLDENLWNAAAREQFGNAVRNLLRLARPDGRVALTDHSWLDDGKRLLTRVARQLRVECQDPRRPMAGRRPASLAEPVSTYPSAHSEAARLAILRPSWRGSSPRLAVDYRDRRVKLELSVGGEVLCAGEWGLQVQCDGAPASITREWEEVCWIADEDVDYLELQATLGEQFVVQRQMLLARRDQCLLLADAVLGQRAGRIEYTGTIPLGRNIRFAPPAETREAHLRSNKRRAVVLPLALGEWRCDGSRGSLTAGEGGFMLAQQAFGQRLYAPLFMGLDSRFLQDEVTWRQLTVAAGREIQSPDVAVGYRAQIGRRQWLIYRSLDLPSVRSVLGQNLNSEFLLGRFRHQGDVDRLLEIEGPE